jgi:hypothetical protein
MPPTAASAHGVPVASEASDAAATDNPITPDAASAARTIARHIVSAR